MTPGLSPLRLGQCGADSVQMPSALNASAATARRYNNRAPIPISFSHQQIIAVVATMGQPERVGCTP
jgi:hypothetical protein